MKFLANATSGAFFSKAPSVSTSSKNCNGMGQCLSIGSSIGQCFRHTIPIVHTFLRCLKVGELACGSERGINNGKK